MLPITVERIEEGVAVLETDEGVRQVPVSQLPDGVREGDILLVEDGGWRRDAAATDARRAQNAGRLKGLFARKPPAPPPEGGDEGVE